jgi:hypothetical protein
VHSVEDVSVLRTAAEISASFKDVGAETANAIRDVSNVTRSELERLRLSQDIAALQAQRSSLLFEIRTLERSRKNRKARRQLKDLRRDERLITQRIDSLNRSLVAGPARDVDAVASLHKAQKSETSNGRGCLAGILIWMVPLLIIMSFFLPSTEDLIDSGYFMFLDVAFFALGLASFFYFRKRTNTLGALIRRFVNLVQRKSKSQTQVQSTTRDEKTDSA